MRLTFRGLALALSLAPSIASAAEGDYVVQTLGSTQVEKLDDDRFEAFSPARKPTVAFAGQSVRIRIEAADAATASSVGTSVEVLEGGVSQGNFVVTFDRQIDPALVRPRATFSGATGYAYTLSKNGTVVAVIDDSDGVAPFVLDRLPDAFDGESIGLAGATATMDNGQRFAVDTMEVREHEVGHLVALRHDHGRMSVSAIGVDALVLDVEADGELEAIESLVFDQAAFDVRGNAANEIHASKSSSAVTARFQPVPGMEQRLRVRVRGTSTWQPTSYSWGLDRIDQHIDVPTMGDEIVYEYQLDRRPTGGSPTIASSGYIRVKKLNSG